MPQVWKRYPDRIRKSFSAPVILYQYWDYPYSAVKKERIFAQRNSTP